MTNGLARLLCYNIVWLALTSCANLQIHAEVVELADTPS
jgi:hypothetical protein